MVIAFLRTIILYLFIIVGIRLMGKRQVGELEPSELVLALLIADLAAVPMQDFGIPLLTGIIPILTLLCLTMALSVLTMKSVRFRAVLCGRPSIIVENGKLHQREMQKNRFTVDELMEELRMKGITDLNSIKIRHFGDQRTDLRPPLRGPAARHCRPRWSCTKGARPAPGDHQRRPGAGAQPAPAGAGRHLAGPAAQGPSRKAQPGRVSPHCG